LSTHIDKGSKLCYNAHEGIELYENKITEDRRMKSIEYKNGVPIPPKKVKHTKTEFLICALLFAGVMIMGYTEYVALGGIITGVSGKAWIDNMIKQGR